jgi:hypothetical protein
LIHQYKQEVEVAGLARERVVAVHCSAEMVILLRELRDTSQLLNLYSSYPDKDEFIDGEGKTI